MHFFVSREADDFYGRELEFSVLLKIERRVLVNVEKVKTYLDSVSEKIPVD